ncbi:MAG: hypothetical protein HRU09_02695 [Oligoflexales bacterium]|nr:hypothetical protein [Oligoflexales bacterium]
MLRRTLYGSNNQFRLLITVPHGSIGEAFFARYPHFWQSFSKPTEIGAFYRYLRIEQDFGAKELSHRFAYWVHTLMPQLGVLVLEKDYPRGILDGGRQLSHCLRSMVPGSLMKELETDLLQVHGSTLDVVRQEIDLVARRGGILVDLHTMAPYCPHFMQGTQTLTEHYDSLEDYLEHFLETKFHHPKFKRDIDLITEDGSGNVIADKELTAAFFSVLSAHYPLAFNDPYAALPHFMMHEYLCSSRGIAIDVPKDLISHQCPPEFNLERFDLSEEKIDGLAKLMAESVQFFFLEQSG